MAVDETRLKQIVSEHFRQPTFFAHLEPKIPTMARPLIVGVDVVGARITKAQNPNIPLTPAAIAHAVVESVQAGATIAHIHVRDKEGAATEDPALNKEVWDRVFEDVDDVVTSNHIMFNRLARGMEMFRGYIDPLVAYGPRYLEAAAVVATDFCEPRGAIAYNISDEEVAELCSYLEERGVKPELQLYAPSSIERIKHALLGEPSKVRRPIWINMHLGKHHAVPVTVDPWSFMWVTTWYSSVRAEFANENVIFGIYVGGRNWLPLTTLAIMLGADVIRVGMEDCLYMYPHRDELIRSNRATVEKIVNIARELDRPVASIAETRHILGIPFREAPAGA